MRTLVTGGAGFIGSSLCEHLLKNGYKVIVIDDLSTGKKENLSQFIDSPNLTVYYDSILNRNLMEEVVGKVDLVFHLAAVVGVKKVLEDPIRCLEVNIGGTDLLLSLAKRRKIKIFIASSSEIYGRGDENIPLKEDSKRVLGPTTATRWAYAATKAVDEFLAINYWRQEKVPTITLRLFNIVGPRQRSSYGMVLPTFIERALTNKPIIVYGDGEQTRSFTHISDLINAILLLDRSNDAYGEVFNVGNKESTTINDLAYRVKELLGSSSQIKHVPFSEVFGENFEETRFRVPDTTKLRSFIGYEPHTPLDKIIIDTSNYIKSSL